MQGALMKRKSISTQTVLLIVLLILSLVIPQQVVAGKMCKSWKKAKKVANKQFKKGQGTKLQKEAHFLC